MFRLNRSYLAKQDRRGYILVAALLLLCAAGYYVYKHNFDTATLPEALTEEQRAELQRFEERVKAEEQRRETEETKQGGGALFPFNPNTADSATLRRLGLAPWQVRNLMKYRRKGGRWRSADDFARLYGLTGEQFARLRPYIVIPPTEEEMAALRREERYDSLRRTYVEKFPAGTVLDLNSVDTTTLKRIPGIGSYYAGKIFRYRQRLGGFVRVEQIKEVGGLPDGIEQWFSVEPNAPTTRLNVNRATFQELVHHPYLEYEQVKAIFSYRQKYGNLHSLRDLHLLEVFTEAEEARLAPYIEF